MLKYIHADLHRIYRRLPRYIIMLAFYLAMLGALFQDAVSKEKNSIAIIGSCGLLFTVAAVLFGALELMMVFADDFKAKTMQIAIGRGVSRAHVVLAKMLEFTALVLGDLAFLALMVVAGSAAIGSAMRAPELYHIVIYVLVFLVNAIIPATFTMILIFYMQSTGLAIILYLIAFLDPVAQIINTAFSTNEIVLALHLNELPFSSLIGVVSNQLGLRSSFPLVQLLGLAVYIVAAYLITVFVFRKRELEF